MSYFTLFICNKKKQKKLESRPIRRLLAPNNLRARRDEEDEAEETAAAVVVVVTTDSTKAAAFQSCLPFSNVLDPIDTFKWDRRTGAIQLRRRILRSVIAVSSSGMRTSKRRGRRLSSTLTRASEACLRRAVSPPLQLASLRSERQNPLCATIALNTIMFRKRKQRRCRRRMWN